MAGWTTHTGLAVVLAKANIDTDQLIPARFMSVPRKDGYGGYLLHDMRRDETGALREGFVLNQHPEASILIAGPDFGSGSSREAAVYALLDAGFRAVIAPSFGDIFSSNAVNNGLLPARISDATYRSLQSCLDGRLEMMTVDLQNRSLRVCDDSVAFDLQDSWRTKLINGWDDIDLTLQHANAIARYKNDRLATAPWTWPRGAA